MNKTMRLALAMTALGVLFLLIGWIMGVMVPDQGATNGAGLMGLTGTATLVFASMVWAVAIVLYFSKKK